MVANARPPANRVKVIGALMCIASIPACMVTSAMGGGPVGMTLMTGVFFVGLAVFVAGRLRD